MAGSSSGVRRASCSVKAHHARGAFTPLSAIAMGSLVPSGARLVLRSSAS
jgi:hypothetical protein